MIEFVVPAIMLFGGILCLLYPERIGMAFCRLGRGIWSVITFGLTDMRWFYSEEKASKTVRIFGVMLILFSIPWGIMGIASVSGPGVLAARRESRGYLSDKYGSAGSWSLSPQAASSGDGDFLVTYRYGHRFGILHARWNGDHYVFDEEAGMPGQTREPRETEKRRN